MFECGGEPEIDKIVALVFDYIALGHGGGGGHFGGCGHFGGFGGGRFARGYGYRAYGGYGGYYEGLGLGLGLGLSALYAFGADPYYGYCGGYPYYYGYNTCYGCGW